MNIFQFNHLCKTRQVLLEAGDTISDSDIDSILGLGGIDDGLSDDEVGSKTKTSCLDVFVTYVASQH